jgi:exopolysaccharide production protein ExoQ
LFLGAVAFLIWRRPHSSLLAIGRWAPALTFAVFALASTLWSQQSGISLRLGFSLVATLVGAVIIADRLTPSQFLGAMWLAMMVVVIGSMNSTHYGETESGPGLAGLTGSKNILGYFSAVGLVASAAMMLDRRQPVFLRWPALAFIPVIISVLIRTKSAGGLVSTLVGMSVFFSLAALHRLSPRGRVLAIIAALIFAVPVAINLHEVKDTVQNFQEDVLKKDRTLTGRTYLWERAAPIIRQRPILGLGYSAFWVPGQLDAEGLWRHSGIGNRSGFSFHNDYIETAVTLGWTGVVLLVLTIIGICTPLFLRAAFAPSIPIIFFAGCVLSMVLKTFTEVGLVNYWSLHTILLFAGAVYGRRGDAVFDADMTRTDAEPASEPRAAGA